MLTHNRNLCTFDKSQHVYQMNTRSQSKTLYCGYLVYKGKTDRTLSFRELLMVIMNAKIYQMQCTGGEISKFRPPNSLSLLSSHTLLGVRRMLVEFGQDRYKINISTANISYRTDCTLCCCANHFWNQVLEVLAVLPTDFLFKNVWITLCLFTLKVSLTLLSSWNCFFHPTVCVA